MSGRTGTPYTYIWEEDQFSEILEMGRYNNLDEVLPKSVASTFDSIAIDKNTRITVYSQLDFQGEIVLQENGPLVLYNMIWSNHSSYSQLPLEEWDEELQEQFPFESRKWSSSNMHDWSGGSLVIERI